jgi:phage head maturation protease
LLAGHWDVRVQLENGKWKLHKLPERGKVAGEAIGFRVHPGLSETLEETDHAATQNRERAVALTDNATATRPMLVL